MIIRKQHLSMSTRQHFKLLRDPFADPQSVEDVYLSPDSRFVRETMHDAAVNGNFLAVRQVHTARGTGGTPAPQR